VLSPGFTALAEKLEAARTAGAEDFKAGRGAAFGIDIVGWTARHILNAQAARLALSFATAIFFVALFLLAAAFLVASAAGFLRALFLAATLVVAVVRFAAALILFAAATLHGYIFCTRAAVNELCLDGRGTMARFTGGSKSLAAEKQHECEPDGKRELDPVHFNPPIPLRKSSLMVSLCPQLVHRRRVGGHQELSAVLAVSRPRCSAQRE
jgi:hypothetical protein